MLVVQARSLGAAGRGVVRVRVRLSKRFFASARCDCQGVASCPTRFARFRIRNCCHWRCVRLADHRGCHRNSHEANFLERIACCIRNLHEFLEAATREQPQILVFVDSCQSYRTTRGIARHSNAGTTRRDRLLQLVAKAQTQSFKKLAIRLATCSAWSCRGFGANDFKLWHFSTSSCLSNAASTCPSRSNSRAVATW